MISPSVWQFAMFENLPTILRPIKKMKHQFQLKIAQFLYPLRNQTDIDENCMETVWKLMEVGVEHKEQDSAEV